MVEPEASEQTAENPSAGERRPTDSGHVPAEMPAADPPAGGAQPLPDEPADPAAAVRDEVAMPEETESPFTAAGGGPAHSGHLPVEPGLAEPPAGGGQPLPDEPADPAATVQHEAAMSAGTESVPAAGGETLTGEPGHSSRVPRERAAAEAAGRAPSADGEHAADESPGETPVETVAAEDLLADAAPQPAAVEDTELKAVLEAIIYVTEEPLALAQLAGALQQPADRIRTLLADLMDEFEKPVHGISIREVAGGYKMATKPEHHEGVRNFVKSLKPPLKLSLAALETLAVIAYKQPVTAPEIMEIRGVQGAGVLKTLLDRKLIAVAGRKNVIGKPILYKTTKDFLVQFGLKDLSELPSLKEFEEIRRMAFSDEPPASQPEAAPAEAQPASEPEPPAGDA